MAKMVILCFLLAAAAININAVDREETLSEILDIMKKEPKAIAAEEAKEFREEPLSRSSLAESFANNVTGEAEAFKKYFDHLKEFVAKFDTLAHVDGHQNLIQLVEGSPRRIFFQVTDFMVFFYTSSRWASDRNHVPQLTNDQLESLNDVQDAADKVKEGIMESILKKILGPIYDIERLSNEETVDMNDIKRRADEFNQLMGKSKIKQLVDDFIEKVDKLPKIFV